MMKRALVTLLMILSLLAVASTALADRGGSVTLGTNSIQMHR